MLGVELSKLIWACAPNNYTGSANTIKYVSLKNYHHLTAVIITGAWAAGTAAVTVNEATAVAGTGATGLAFNYYWHDETTSGTLVRADATNAGTTTATFNLDTANKMYVIEIDGSSLSVNSGFDCVGVAIASPGANNDYYAVAYILSQGRDMSSSPASALVD